MSLLAFRAERAKDAGVESALRAFLSAMSMADGPALVRCCTPTLSWLGHTIDRESWQSAENLRPLAAAPVELERIHLAPELLLSKQEHAHATWFAAEISRRGVCTYLLVGLLRDDAGSWRVCAVEDGAARVRALKGRVRESLDGFLTGEK